MKIVIQGVEICGIIAELARELKLQGHCVTTIADCNRFYEGTYDYRLAYCLHDLFPPRTVLRRLNAYVARVLNRVSKPTYAALSAFLRERICLSADLYIQVWSGWHGEYRLLKQLRENNVKIATLFMGSEIRHYPRFQQQYGEMDWELPEQYSSTLETKLIRLRTHERYADAIFSVPDQMGLARRPYHHLLAPIAYKDIECYVPDRQKPLVVHAPTNEGVKGSPLIESVLGELRDEGVPFDYLRINEVPHKTLLKILKVADVLVDQILLHGPGWLGHEAMAAGCAVATRYLDDSPAIFRPPVHRIDRRTVKSQLRLLLTDQGLRRKLAVDGRRYVEANNAPSRVVNHIISRTLDGNGKEDYRPDCQPEVCA